MRAPHALSLIVAITACGPGNPKQAAAPGPVAGALSPAIDPRVSSAYDPVTPTRIPAAPDLVWKALLIVYDSLGLKLSIYDPAQHLLGTEGMPLRHKLGNVMLSRYLDCGRGQVDLSADSYDVLLAVMTHVSVSDSGVTRVSLRVAAAARPPTLSQAYSRCSSKGELEKRFFELLNASLRSMR
jgi:hypothetical protein